MFPKNNENVLILSIEISKIINYSFFPEDTEDEKLVRPTKMLLNHFSNFCSHAAGVDVS
jgi:hypothetical protein